jgi:hypothetical protein
MNVLHDEQAAAPDNTAVRVALWRALHLEVDSPPHVLEDEVGLKLAAPDDGWRSRPDMSPFTRPLRNYRWRALRIKRYKLHRNPVTK